MPANPRMGISYSSSCPSMKKYYPSMFFKQHLCECISLWNPLDCSNSSTFWQMGGQSHLPFALLWETRCFSCARGPELNTDFRSSQQPQAGVAEAVLWIDTLLKQSFLDWYPFLDGFWLFGKRELWLSWNTAGVSHRYPLQNPCFHGLNHSFKRLREYSTEEDEIWFKFGKK